MKKILAIMALAVSFSAFADSVTMESQRVNNATGNDQQIYLLGYKATINDKLTADVLMSNVETDNTHALGTRLEAGVTGTTPLFGSVSGYTRVGLGQKYSNTANFSYYSVEPGVSAPVGPFTAKVGWRWRSAMDSDKNNDQTHTMRYTLSYAVNKVNTVYVRYDRVNGDNDQKIVTFGYARSL